MSGATTPWVGQYLTRGAGPAAYGDDGAVRINVWSGPRCLSTALMYSFAQRDDAACADEPMCVPGVATPRAKKNTRPVRIATTRPEATARYSHPRAALADFQIRYAHHLRLNPSIYRPYRDELMRAQCPDGGAVARHLLLAPPRFLVGGGADAAAPPPPPRVVYLKHMAKQAEGVDKEVAGVET